jgi:hypothetical protein
VEEGTEEGLKKAAGLFGRLAQEDIMRSKYWARKAAECEAN